MSDFKTKIDVDTLKVVLSSESMTRKTEEFADSFATAYGYGAARFLRGTPRGSAVQAQRHMAEHLECYQRLLSRSAGRDGQDPFCFCGASAFHHPLPRAGQAHDGDD